MTIWELVEPISWRGLWAATGMVTAYLGFLFLGALLLPGLERLGYPLPDGTRRRYKLTGLTLFLWTHVGVFVLVHGFSGSLTPMIRHFWSLFVVVNVVAVKLSLALYLWGRRSHAVLRAPVGGGRLPRFIEDLWFGNELNPNWFGVDLKMWLYQPSLIGVGLFVAAFGFAQYELTGSLTPQMSCFLAFWWLYLWTHYVKEEFMLSTWDVIAENFGFMLVWGDLVYVPFLYSLPGWWVANDTTHFPVWAWMLLSLFFLLALVVFRDANWQKERYKRDREAPIWGQPPETVGGRLLVSGWWGIGRKINYTGELGVYLAFSLCAGITHWQPFVVPLSLTILLVQRAHRDDRRCRAKYGELWEEYCRRVRFRIFPFVY